MYYKEDSIIFYMKIKVLKTSLKYAHSKSFNIDELDPSSMQAPPNRSQPFSSSIEETLQVVIISPESHRLYPNPANEEPWENGGLYRVVLAAVVVVVAVASAVTLDSWIPPPFKPTSDRYPSRTSQPPWEESKL